MRDNINKAARFIINWCLSNDVSQVVFGWDRFNKDGIKIGKKNNQEFVQIPTARLKNRMSQLCEQYGIQFTETEESYTSQASFLDDDFLPKFGEKLDAGIRSMNPNKEASSRRPEQWKASGKRVKRGLYHTSNGEMINADCNGAANIIRLRSDTVRFRLNRGR